MKHPLQQSLTRLRHIIRRNRPPAGPGTNFQTDLLQAVENVVDGTDSSIRLVPGYQKKLQGIIGATLQYSEELANRIPGPIEISRSTFVSDPYVNAFFTNVADLQSIFSHSSEVRDYMGSLKGNDDSRFCALLCMKKTEKTTTGIELAGDMLKRDVRQVAVNFSEHRVYSPAPAEYETRRALRNCLFQGLVTNSLGRIIKLKLEHHHLQVEHRMAHGRLRRAQQKARSVDEAGHPASGLAAEISEASQALATIENEMMRKPVLTPQALLQQVLEVFSNPTDFVKVSKGSVRLNKMGIRISEDSAQPANNLELTEVVIENEMPRVVTLAEFPTKELQPGRAFPSVEPFPAYSIGRSQA